LYLEGPQSNHAEIDKKVLESTDSAVDPQKEREREKDRSRINKSRKFHSPSQSNNTS